MSPTCNKDGACPHCSTELAGLLSDQVHGRFEAAAARLRALTARTLRILGAGLRHPAAAFVAATDTAPAVPNLGDAIRESRRPAGDMAAKLSAGLPPIGPAAPARSQGVGSSAAPTMPSMADALNARRS